MTSDLPGVQQQEEGMCTVGSWDVLTFMKSAARDLFLDSDRIIFAVLFPLVPQLLSSRHGMVPLPSVLAMLKCYIKMMTLLIIKGFWALHYHGGEERRLYLISL